MKEAVKNNIKTGWYAKTSKDIGTEDEVDDLEIDQDP